MKVHVSKHAEKRIRKRLGIPKSAVCKEVERAFYGGVTYSQSKGQLRQYFTKIFRKSRSQPLIRVYNHYAWVFTKVDKSEYLLMTTYNIPSTLYKLEEAIRITQNVKEDQ